MKKITSIILCICILIIGITPAYGVADSKTVQKTVMALEIISGDENGNLNLIKNVTRAEFAKMLIKASVYRDSIQEGSGSSPFKDVKYTHWASDYIKVAVTEGWMSGYVNGSFQPEKLITFEEAASAVLKLLGYGTSNLSGTYPNAQISKFKALKLSTGISPIQGKALTRNECMYIFYNIMSAKDVNGSLYGTTLGYAMNSEGEIDYGELIKSHMEGPYAIKNTTLAAILPFDISQATIYRNGSSSVSSEYQQYDVVYYNSSSKDVWLYSNRIVGTYTAIAPDSVSPSSITVGGNNYGLGTPSAKNKVSSIGEFSIGDKIALILGMSGEVVDVVSAKEVDSVYYGVVTKTELSTYDVNSSKSNAEYLLSVACTDGIVRQFAVNSASYKVGRVVSASYTNGELAIKGLGSGSISGTVSSDGTKLGEFLLSDNVEILDVSKDGQWTVIYPNRLFGVALKSEDIHYYSLDSNKKITHLILDDVTGDMYDYGILIDVVEVVNDQAAESPRLNGTYNYVIKGNNGILNTTNVLYNTSEGPAIFYHKDGKIDGMKNLKKADIDKLSYMTVISNNQKFEIADNVQVYIQSKKNEFVLTQLNAVNTDEYILAGYYETSYSAGEQVRIIIAKKK